MQLTASRIIYAVHAVFPFWKPTRALSHATVARKVSMPIHSAYVSPRVILTLQNYGSSGVAWACTDCRIGEVTNGGSPHKALTQLNTTVKSLCSAVRVILTSEKAAAQKKRTNDSTHFPDFTREEAAEMSARNRRRLSLIVRGILGNRGQFLTSFWALAFNTIGKSDSLYLNATA